MGFVRCPNCGALNAASQKMCPQCEMRLDLQPLGPSDPPQVSAPKQICKHCKHATVFPPVGYRLFPDEVWCTLADAARPGDGAAEECFELSFTWRREERLD